VSTETTLGNTAEFTRANSLSTEAISATILAATSNNILTSTTTSRAITQDDYIITSKLQINKLKQQVQFYNKISFKSNQSD
jgi:hypothetical protein